jgi:NitT/TauT family transport system permease protein
MSKPVWSAPPVLRGWSWGDAVAILALAALLYLDVRLALGAPAGMQGPDISLAPGMLPWYAALSMGRMAGAYALSLAFTLIVGYLAAYSRRAEMVILPALDILQSVPILSFLPVVLLGLSAVLPQALATELAAVVLIFTSQVWNMTVGAGAGRDVLARGQLRCCAPPE